MKPIEHWENLSLDDIIIEIEGEKVIEKWEQIKNYEGYYDVSNFGRFKSLFRVVPHSRQGTKSIKERILRQNKGDQGYLKIDLYKHDVFISKPSHVWVAETWIDNPQNKPTVNHDNGIKWDNRVSNLGWATQKEQDEHARRTGLKVPFRGEQLSFTKLKDKEVLEIFNSTLKNKDLAILYNINESIICGIKKGRKRSFLTGKEFINSRLTEEKIIQIFNNRLPLRKAAKLFGVSYSSIRMIRTGKRYSDIIGKVQDAIAGI